MVTAVPGWLGSGCSSSSSSKSMIKLSEGTIEGRGGVPVLDGGLCMRSARAFPPSPTGCDRSQHPLLAHHLCSHGRLKKDQASFVPIALWQLMRSSY